MDRKNIFLSVIFFVLVVVDCSISGKISVYFSLSFLAEVLPYLDYVKSVYLALVTGFIFDVFFSRFIGQFIFPSVLFTVIVQTIESYYAINRLILSELLLFLFFVAMFAFSRNPILFEGFFYTALLTVLWHVALRKIEVHPLEKRNAA
ncbi:MAG: hypothetical protein ACP5SB_01650 [Caldisericaceae bacterium]